MIEDSRAFAERETRIAPPRLPDKLQPVKVTMPEPEPVTRQGKPRLRHPAELDFAEEVAWKNGAEGKSTEFVEKGAEVYAKA